MAGHLLRVGRDKGASIVRLDAGCERLLAALSEGMVVRILLARVRMFKVMRTPRDKSHRARVSEAGWETEDQFFYIQHGSP
jgi:hypothetical protein